MKKITFFEFSDRTVSSGMVPAKLCHMNGDFNRIKNFSILATAENVYEVIDNTAVMIKNRFGPHGTVYHISDEDMVVLKLKSVLI